MGKSRVQSRRIWRGRALVTVVILACLASLVGAATAGTRTPSTAAVGKLTGEGGLDYSKDSAARLRRLDPDFVAQSLGLTLPGSPGGSPSAGPTGVTGGSTAGIATGPPVNPVTTPTFQCVNGHQTADPLSPACVAQFTGDNGGSTWQGVSGNEIVVLGRMKGNSGDPNAPADNAVGPTETMYDLGKAPDPKVPEIFWLHELRLWQEYFNKHYQLYGRRVHFYVWFDSDVDNASLDVVGRHERRAALDNLFSVGPFVAIQAPANNADDHTYLETLARNGAVAFDPYNLQPSSRYERAPGRIWGYQPTTEHLAELYATYVCQKMVHQPTAMSGNAGDNGRPRRFGVLVPGDPSLAKYREMAAAIKDGVRRCGGDIVAEASFPTPSGCRGFQLPTGGADPSEDFPGAIANLQRFRAAGVTTVLWLGCHNGAYGPAATSLRYLPEWTVLGDSVLDGSYPYVVQDNLDAAFDHHAITITSKTFAPELEASYCYRALRETDPTLPASYPGGTPTGIDHRTAFVTPRLDAQRGQQEVACQMYPGLRQIFTALQVAGPRLTPHAVEAALQSLPYLESPDPQTPSCFYGQTFTCTQDAIAQYYDGGTQCWRAVEGGRRYLAGKWPDGNVTAQIHGGEPCNWASA